MKVSNIKASQPLEVLQYLGYSDDRGGILSVVRAMSAEGRFRSCLGVNPDFIQTRSPAIELVAFPPLAGEAINPQTWWRSRQAALQAKAWLSARSGRVFHAHSRAGLLVALWLFRWKVRRIVVSVHCYGRQRWFYRWAGRRLGSHLYWLSPAMKAYYGVGAPTTWDQCVPGCFAPSSPMPTGMNAGPPGLLRLGGIGSLVAWKGWELILAALAQLPAGVKERVRFQHMGSADGSPASLQYAHWLREETRRLGLEDQVAWLGEKESSQAFLASIDCLVSTAAREPFSVSILEALAAAVPVIAARAGGATDLIHPGNGWLYEPSDAPSLARTLATLATGEARGTLRFSPDDLAPFSASVVARKWADIYAALP